MVRFRIPAYREQQGCEYATRPSFKPFKGFLYLGNSGGNKCCFKGRFRKKCLLTG